MTLPDPEVDNLEDDDEDFYEEPYGIDDVETSDVPEEAPDQSQPQDPEATVKE